LHSMKTVGLTLPKGYSYYYVDAKYTYSVPILDSSEWGDAKVWKTVKTNEFGTGLSVITNPTQFTIVTTTRAYTGKGSSSTAIGQRFLHGGYTLLVDPKDPAKPLTYDNGIGTFSGRDPKQTVPADAGYDNLLDGYVHLLPTVQYTVYAVKSGFLTTGGTLVQTIK